MFLLARFAEGNVYASGWWNTTSLRWKERVYAHLTPNGDIVLDIDPLGAQMSLQYRGESDREFARRFARKLF